MLDLLSQQLGSVLNPARLTVLSGERVAVDGADADLSVLVECWAHQGPPKSAQRHKALADAWAVAIAPRPGPAPGCTDAELLAIALVRYLLGRRSEAGFLAEVARDWGHLFPQLPHQSEANRRIRWLRGAFEQLRAMLRPGGPKMTASRSMQPRCRSGTPPGSAARTAGPGRATT